MFARWWLGIKVNDSTSGFRCFKREVLENIGLETIQSKGYLFQIEVIYRCLKLRYRYNEVPIAYVERKMGKTKLGLHEVWEAFRGVLRLRFFKITPLCASHMPKQQVDKEIKVYQEDSIYG